MTLSNQDVVDTICKKMDCLSLSERNWIRKLQSQSDIDAANRQLWECLVAFYLEDLGYQPKRFSPIKTNLDFGFSINEQSFYGECVCPADGDSFTTYPSEGMALASVEGIVESSTNSGGLRVTNSIVSKQIQTSKFHEEKGANPTILFLNTGLLKGLGAPLSRINSPLLSNVVAALYGIDGVPAYGFNKDTNQWLGAVATHSSNLLKLSGKPINRRGFCDGSLSAISAVMNCSIDPFRACSKYLNGGLIKNIFNEHAELIVNGCAGHLALNDIAIFPSAVPRIFSCKDVIVLEQAGEQQCFRVVTPTVRAELVEASQSTLRPFGKLRTGQAQGERESL